MGIQKDKLLNIGVTGSYWKIINITVDKRNSKITGSLALYVNKAASDAGFQPLPFSKTFSLPLVPSEIAPPVDLIEYAYIKIQENANQIISEDPMGNPLETPLNKDPDIANGVYI